MIRASKLFAVIEGIKLWFEKAHPLTEVEETISIKPGRLLCFYRENAMLDPYDRPQPYTTAQDFINAMFLYLAVLALQRSKRRF